jgi:hypothetical protein
MVGPGTAQMFRDVVAATATTLREPAGWAAFGAMPLMAYLYDRHRWKTWTAAWAAVALGWWLLPRPTREFWTSDGLGATWIALAVSAHAMTFALRFSIRRRRAGPARSRSVVLRLLLVGWTAAILLHPSVVLWRVTRDWYDCPCQRQPLP